MVPAHISFKGEKRGDDSEIANWNPITESLSDPTQAESRKQCNFLLENSSCILIKADNAGRETNVIPKQYSVLPCVLAQVVS